MTHKTREEAAEEDVSAVEFQSHEVIQESSVVNSMGLNEAEHSSFISDKPDLTQEEYERLVMESYSPANVATLAMPAESLNLDALDDWELDDLPELPKSPGSPGSPSSRGSPGSRRVPSEMELKEIEDIRKLKQAERMAEEIKEREGERAVAFQRAREALSSLREPRLDNPLYGEMASSGIMRWYVGYRFDQNANEKAAFLLEVWLSFLQIRAMRLWKMDVIWENRVQTTYKFHIKLRFHKMLAVWLRGIRAFRADKHWNALQNIDHWRAIKLSVSARHYTKWRALKHLHRARKNLSVPSFLVEYKETEGAMEHHHLVRIFRPTLTWLLRRDSLAQMELIVRWNRLARPAWESWRFHIRYRHNKKAIERFHKKYVQRRTFRAYAAYVRSQLKLQRENDSSRRGSVKSGGSARIVASDNGGGEGEEGEEEGDEEEEIDLSQYWNEGAEKPGKDVDDDWGPRPAGSITRPQRIAERKIRKEIVKQEVENVFYIRDAAEVNKEVLVRGVARMKSLDHEMKERSRRKAGEVDAFLEMKATITMNKRIEVLHEVRNLRTATAPNKMFKALDRGFRTLQQEYNAIAMTYAFGQFALSVHYRHRQQALSEVIIRRRLRICQRLNYLDRGMHVYYDYRLKNRMFRRWLRYLDTKYTYETPTLSEDCKRRYARLGRFSTWLKRGGGWAQPRALIYRWMEYTQRRVQKRRIVGTMILRRYTRLMRIAFVNFKLELNMYVDKSVTHFLEDRAEWDLRLLDSNRRTGHLLSDVLRRKKKIEVERRKVKAKKMNNMDHVLKVHFQEVWERIKGEQMLLMGLFAKRNRGLQAVESLKALREHHCKSTELSLRSLEAFRAMDADHSGTVDFSELRDALEKLPPKYGKHDVEHVLEWVTQFGNNKHSFDFEQWVKSFEPHMELSETQQVEIMKRRKYEIMATMESCHSWARRMLSGRNPLAAKMGLTNQSVTIAMCKWLFDAKSHQLPKPPDDLKTGEWVFPETDYYREHIDMICKTVQHEVRT